MTKAQKYAPVKNGNGKTPRANPGSIRPDETVITVSMEDVIDKVYVRQNLDEGHIQYLVMCIENSVELPPVILEEIGAIDGRTQYRRIHGNHTFEAYTR